jgi:tetratricopeptide (TPR) repeat protein
MYEQGKYSDAAQLYEQAAQLAPDSPVPLYNRAAALFQSGDFAAAAKLYEQARARAPKDLRPQINYALGNCHLQQSLGSQAQPAQAAPEAKAAVDFYRDAISSAPASANAGTVRDAARHNLELAKRLIQQLEQRQQQQPQPSQDGDKEQPKDQQNRQNSDPTNPRGQDKQSPDRAQPSDPSPQQQDQQQPSDSSDDRSPQKAGSARDQLSPDEAAERLRAAIARAQMARARRLNDQDKRAKGKAVERDW